MAVDQHALVSDDRPVSAEDPWDSAYAAMEREQAEIARWQEFDGDIVPLDSIAPDLAYAHLEDFSKDEKEKLISSSLPFFPLCLQGPIADESRKDKNGNPRRSWRLAIKVPHWQGSEGFIWLGYGVSDRDALLMSIRPVLRAGKTTQPLCIRGVPTDQGNDYLKLVPYRPKAGERVTPLKIVQAK